jgi:hypothetical protein
MINIRGRTFGEGEYIHPKAVWFILWMQKVERNDNTEEKPEISHFFDNSAQ